jgi:hypothetical protein
VDVVDSKFELGAGEEQEEVATGAELELVAREARTRGPGGFSTLNAKRGEARRRLLGPITADASVSRCLAQTRLDWDRREDGRGPDAGRGRDPTLVHRVSSHISQAARDSQRRSCYVCFSAAIPLLSPCAHYCPGQHWHWSAGCVIYRTARSSRLFDASGLFNVFSALSSARFVCSMRCFQAALGHLRSMTGSHFFVFGPSIALTTSCHCRPAPHGTPTAPGHGVTTAGYACYAAASVSANITNHQSSIILHLSASVQRVIFVSSSSRELYTVHTTCLDEFVGQIHTRMMSIEGSARTANTPCHTRRPSFPEPGRDSSRGECSRPQKAHC